MRVQLHKLFELRRISQKDPAIIQNLAYSTGGLETNSSPPHIPDVDIFDDLNSQKVFQILLESLKRWE
jgi:hypothetical protein